MGGAPGAKTPNRAEGVLCWQQRQPEAPGSVSRFHDATELKGAHRRVEKQVTSEMTNQS